LFFVFYKKKKDSSLFFYCHLRTSKQHRKERLKMAFSPFATRTATGGGLPAMLTPNAEAFRSVSPGQNQPAAIITNGPIGGILSGAPAGAVPYGLFARPSEAFTGYAGLNTPATAEWQLDPSGVPKVAEGAAPALNEFMSRFGLQAVVKRNANLLETLQHPEETVRKMNGEYYLMASELATMYNTYYNELLVQGVSSMEATAKSDEYIKPLITSRLQLLALKFPYNFGSTAWAANQEMNKTLFSKPGAGGQSLAALSDLNQQLSSAQPYGKKGKKKKKKNKFKGVGVPEGGSVF